jgi:hypothetical protein
MVSNMTRPSAWLCVSASGTCSDAETWAAPDPEETSAGGLHAVTVEARISQEYFRIETLQRHGF